MQQVQEDPEVPAAAAAAVSPRGVATTVHSGDDDRPLSPARRVSIASSNFEPEGPPLSPLHAHYHAFRAKEAAAQEAAVAGAGLASNQTEQARGSKFEASGSNGVPVPAASPTKRSSSASSRIAMPSSDTAASCASSAAAAARPASASAKKPSAASSSSSSAAKPAPRSSSHKATLSSARSAEPSPARPSSAAVSSSGRLTRPTAASEQRRQSISERKAAIAAEQHATAVAEREADVNSRPRFPYLQRSTGKAAGQNGAVSPANSARGIGARKSLASHFEAPAAAATLKKKPATAAAQPAHTHDDEEDDSAALVAAAPEPTEEETALMLQPRPSQVLANLDAATGSPRVHGSQMPPALALANLPASASRKVPLSLVGRTGATNAGCPTCHTLHLRVDKQNLELHRAQEQVQKLEHMRGVSEQLQRERHAKQAEIDLLTQRLAKSDARCNLLSHQLTTLRLEQDRHLQVVLQQQSAAQEAALRASTAKTIAQALADADQARTERAETNLEKKGLLSKLSTLAASKRSLERTLSSLEQSYKTLQEHHEVLLKKHSLAAAEAAAASGFDGSDRVTDEVLVLQQANERLASQLQQTRQERTQVEQEAEVLRTEVDQLRDRLAAAEHDQHDDQTHYRELYTQAQAALEAETRTSADLATQVRAEREQARALRAQLDRAQQQHVQLQQAYDIEEEDVPDEARRSVPSASGSRAKNSSRSIDHNHGGSGSGANSPHPAGSHSYSASGHGHSGRSGSTTPKPSKIPVPTTPRDASPRPRHASPSPVPHPHSHSHSQAQSGGSNSSKAGAHAFCVPPPIYPESKPKSPSPTQPHSGTDRSSSLGMRARAPSPLNVSKSSPRGSAGPASAASATASGRASPALRSAPAHSHNEAAAGSTRAEQHSSNHDEQSPSARAGDFHAHGARDLHAASAHQSPHHSDPASSVAEDSFVEAVSFIARPSSPSRSPRDATAAAWQEQGQGHEYNGRSTHAHGNHASRRAHDDQSHSRGDHRSRMPVSSDALASPEQLQRSLQFFRENYTDDASQQALLVLEGLMQQAAILRAKMDSKQVALSSIGHSSGSTSGATPAVSADRLRAELRVLGNTLDLTKDNIRTHWHNLLARADESHADSAAVPEQQREVAPTHWQAASPAQADSHHAQSQARMGSSIFSPAPTAVRTPAEHGSATSVHSTASTYRPFVVQQATPAAAAFLAAVQQSAAPTAQPAAPSTAQSASRYPAWSSTAPRPSQPFVAPNASTILSGLSSGPLRSTFNSSGTAPQQFQPYVQQQQQQFTAQQSQQPQQQSIFTSGSPAASSQPAPAASQLTAAFGAPTAYRFSSPSTFAATQVASAAGAPLSTSALFSPAKQSSSSSFAPTVAATPAWPRPSPFSNSVQHVLSGLGSTPTQQMQPQTAMQAQPQVQPAGSSTFSLQVSKDAKHIYITHQSQPAAAAAPSAASSAAPFSNLLRSPSSPDTSASIVPAPSGSLQSSLSSPFQRTLPAATPGSTWSFQRSGAFAQSPSDSASGSAVATPWTSPAPARPMFQQSFSAFRAGSTPAVLSFQSPQNAQQRTAAAAPTVMNTYRF